MRLAFPLGRQQIHRSACIYGMAGLYSIIGAVASSGLELGSATRRHRGPGATDSYQADRIGMVPVHLTIIHLTDGKQPLSGGLKSAAVERGFQHAQSKSANWTTGVSA